MSLRKPRRTLSERLRILAQRPYRRTPGASDLPVQPLEQRVLFSVPAAPTDLAVDVKTGRHAHLTWVDNSTDETEFKVKASKDGGATWFQVGTAPANQNAGADFTATNLDPSTDYTFSVTASNADGDSANATDGSNSEEAATFGPLGIRHYSFEDSDDEGWSGGGEEVVYANDGVTVVNRYRKGPTTLNLSDLPEHVGIQVSFTAIIVDKYDGGIGMSGVGDGVSTDVSNDWRWFATETSGRRQSFPASSGSRHMPYTGAAWKRDINRDQRDDLNIQYSTVLNIADSAYGFTVSDPEHDDSTLTLSFTGASASDHHFGIDDVSITLIMPPCGCGHEGADPMTGGYNEYDEDLSSGGGTGFGHSTKVSSAETTGVANRALGNGVADTNLPVLTQATPTLFAVVAGTSATQFDYDAATNTFMARDGAKDTLQYRDIDPNNPSLGKEYVLTSSSGGKARFHDFRTSHPAALRGHVKSFTDAGGNGTSVTYYADNDPADDSRNKVKEVRRTAVAAGVTYAEVFAYEYHEDGDNAGLLKNVKLRRGRSDVGGGAEATVRQAEYSYYGSSDAHGNLNDLKLVEIKDGAGALIDRRHYRFYKTGQSGGYAGALKLLVREDGYARLTAAGINPLLSTTPDSAIKPYAAVYLEFDATTRRVKKRVEFDDRETTYAYAQSEHGTGRNAWRHKMIASRADGSKEITYANDWGQTILEVFEEPGADPKRWRTYHEYDGDGREVLTAHPSAVSGHDEALEDLVGKARDGTYLHIRDAEGLIERNEYYDETGWPEGFLYEQSIQRGDTTAPVKQRTLYYTYQTATDGSTVYEVSSEAVYRNEDGTGAQTTNYYYTFFPGTTQVESVQTVRPSVGAEQNGPGSADEETVFYDTSGREVWRRDADGFLHYLEYDPGTGAVTKQITDVDTAESSDFTGLPGGWSDPADGGLHLVTLTRVDGLGRTTKLTDPEGNNTFTVYNDAAHEARTYRGWTGTTTTRPIEVVRQYRPAFNSQGVVYKEQLTSSATPTVDGNGEPTGSENLDDAATIQSLARDFSNRAGQLVVSDQYHNLSGLTYSRSVAPDSNLLPVGLGAKNTNFYRSEWGYDAAYRLVRAVNAVGTVRRTVYDARGQVTSRWIGTDDTPDTGTWSPANTAGTNLVKWQENAYDQWAAAPGVGDGNVTQTTLYPGTGQTDRVTRMYYDWRNRLRATKSGVEATESTSTNRPITYTDYDNFDRPTAYYLYDGDAITVGTTGGVPDKPAGINLRSLSRTEYDEVGRVFGRSVVGVNQTTGIDGLTTQQVLDLPALKTDYWYDKRGNAVMTRPAGGALQEMQYDGAGRLTRVFLTDGSGGTAWSNAGNATGDNVVEQTEYAYDKNGNVVLTTRRQRFHNATGTGELANPSTSPTARVSYAAAYYDAAGRVTAQVEHGTNGGAAFSRSARVPGRDTVTGTATGGTTTSLVDTGRTESAAADEDYFVGYTIRITSGTGSGQTSIVTDYNPSTKTFTVSPAFTTAPGNGSGYSLTPNALVTTYAYAADEVQAVTVSGSPTGGTFTLAFNGQTTSGLAHNASAAAVQTALQALSSVGSGNVAVTGAAGGPYVVRFIGSLAETNVAQMTASSSLTGGSPSIAVTTQSPGGAVSSAAKVTDPRGIVQKSDVDLLGRLTRTVEAFADGVPSSGDDRTTAYTYNGNDDVLTMTALTDGAGAFQSTEYVYGVTVGGGNDLTSNDLLREVRYPDKTTGSPGTAAWTSRRTSTTPWGRRRR